MKISPLSINKIKIYFKNDKFTPHSHSDLHEINDNEQSDSLVFALKSVAFNACQVILNTNSTGLRGEPQTSAQHECKVAFSQRTAHLTSHCRLPIVPDSADMPSRLFIHLSHEPVSTAKNSDQRTLGHLSESLICSIVHSFIPLKSLLNPYITRYYARLWTPSIHRSAVLQFVFFVWSTIKDTIPLRGNCSS